MKNTQSKIKAIKIGKRLGTTNCFRCKEFYTKKVKMTNEILREKPHCVVSGSNKSRFVKKKKKLTINFIIIRWILTA